MTPPIIPRWQQWVFVAAAGAMIAVSLVVPLAYIRLSDQDSDQRETIRSKAEAACADVNDVRDGIVAYVEGTAARSRNALEARVANPESDPEEVEAARENLVRLEAQLADLNETFAANECE
jgi:hypothetical protein